MTMLTKAWGIVPPLLLACGSSGPSVPGDGGPVQLAAETYYAVLFVEGSSARYRVTEVRSQVKPEVAERGGTPGPNDWINETRKGELTCTVKRVQTFGDRRVSTILCDGFDFPLSEFEALVSGWWLETPRGIYHSYEELTEEWASRLPKVSGPQLERPIQVGVRFDEEATHFTEIMAGNVCVTSQYDSVDARWGVCFSPGRWPDDISGRLRAARVTTTVKLERVR